MYKITSKNWTENRVYHQGRWYTIEEWGKSSASVYHSIEAKFIDALALFLTSVTLIAAISAGMILVF